MPDDTPPARPARGSDASDSTRGPGSGPDRGSREWRLETLAVHAGLEPDEMTGGVAPPIHVASTFEQDGVGRPRGGWEYARTANPTRSRLEASVAALEGARYGLSFASGSATTAAIAGLALPGEEILVSDDVYGGTYRFFERLLRDTGIEAVYADLSGDARTRLAELLGPRTRLIWLESPSNPLLKLIDIGAVSDVAREHTGARGEPPIVVVDNTFATPLGQRPLELGADISYHSATKYLSGHSDVINGALATSRDDVHERLKFVQNAVGAVPGPFDCFLVLRGIRTLAVRMQRHSSNAMRVAEALSTRDDVEWLRYPGLRGGRHAHPDGDIALRQMQLCGGMVSFRPAAKSGRSAEDRARRFCETTELFAIAESLGGVESLVEIPAAMTHLSVADSPLETPAALVRLSVGIEHPDDLVADVTAALDRA